MGLRGSQRPRDSPLSYPLIAVRKPLFRRYLYGARKREAVLFGAHFGQTRGIEAPRSEPSKLAFAAVRESPLSKVISMPDRYSTSQPRIEGVRDRRYTIRFPFAADVQIIDLETGQHVEGVTSDLSLGGCFVCTSKPMPIGSRGRLTMTRKDQRLEALVVVRIVKPRVGMGIEFFDLEPPNNDLLANWLDALRRKR